MTTALAPASGTQLLSGLKLEQQVPGEQAGAPTPRRVAHARIAKPTTAAGIGTGKTGDFMHKVLAMYPDGSWSEPSIASDKVALTNDNVVITYVPDTGAVAHRGLCSEATAGVEDHSLVTGLEDFSFTGDYTGIRSAVIEVKVSTTGTPDKFRWRVTYEGPASAWSAEISMTGAPQALTDGVLVTATATTGHIADDVVKFSVTRNYIAVGENWDATSTTITEGYAAGTGDTAIPVIKDDQTAANYGFMFARTRPATEYSRDDTFSETTELSGAQGPPTAIPDEVKYAHTEDDVLRTAADFRIKFASLIGKPVTSTQAAGKPEWTDVFQPSNNAEDAVSFSQQHYKGGSIAAQYFHRNRAVELDLSFPEGVKEIGAKWTVMGMGDTTHSYGIMDTDGGTTSPYAPVIFGHFRQAIVDAADDVYVKVQTVLTAGVMKVRTKIGSGSFSTTDLLVYADSTAGNRQYRPTTGAVEVCLTELFDASGLAIGIDADETLKPVGIYFPGDLSTYAAGTIYKFATKALFPGKYSSAHPTGPADDGTYTGQIRRIVDTARFTAQRVVILKGPTSATDYVPFLGGTLKFAQPYQTPNEKGRFGVYPKAIDLLGKQMITLDADRRFITREFEEAMKYGSLFTTRLTFPGSPIRTHLGVYGAAESITFDFPSMQVMKTDSKTKDDKATPEKITLLARQPNPDVPLFTATFVSPMPVDWASL